MCEQAVEIQESYEPKEGDYLYSKKYDEVDMLAKHDCCSGDYCQDPEWNYALEFRTAWLPRIDQLIEMIDWSPNITIYQDGDDWYLTWQELVGTVHSNLQNKTFISRGKSLEICWLSYYMKRSYNKTWTGEKWE